MKSCAELRGADDLSLLSGIREVVVREHEALVEILRYLDEIGRRKLYLKEGYSSMFAFCTGKLGYSESAASRRIRAARLIGRFPRVGVLLEQNKLNLSTVSALYSVLNEDNVNEAIALTVGRSQREVDVVVAKYQEPNLKRTPDRICPVFLKEDVAPYHGNGALQVITNNESFATPIENEIHNRSGCELEEKNALQQNELTSATQKLRITFGAEVEFLEKVEKAKQILSHKYPKGVKLEDVFGEALMAFLDKHGANERAKRREEKRARIREISLAEGKRSRHIPARIRDLVFIRDKGRCTFVGPEGKVCGSNWDVEIDHIRPWSLGGGHEVENLRLLCSGHNQLRNEVEDGPALNPMS